MFNSVILQILSNTFELQILTVTPSNILRRFLFFVTQLNVPYQGCLRATSLWWASNLFVHPQCVAVACSIFRESLGGTNAFHV